MRQSVKAASDIKPGASIEKFLQAMLCGAKVTSLTKRKQNTLGYLNKLTQYQVLPEIQKLICSGFSLYASFQGKFYLYHYARKSTLA